MYKEITRNYGLRYGYENYKQYEADFEITLREYPPQKRTIKYFKLTKGRKKHFIELDFPYLQFYYLENKVFNQKHFFSFYLTGSETSVFENGQPKALFLPNSASDGTMCLSEGHWRPKSIDDVVNKFWHSTFSYDVAWKNGNAMLFKKSCFVPNIAHNEEIVSHNAISSTAWTPLDV